MEFNMTTTAVLVPFDLRYRMTLPCSDGEEKRSKIAVWGLPILHAAANTHRTTCHSAWPAAPGDRRQCVVTTAAGSVVSARGGEEEAKREIACKR